MKIDKRILLLVSIIAIIGFLIMFSSSIFEKPDGEPIEDFQKGFRRVPMYRLWLSPLLLVVGLIFASYYIISKKMEDNVKMMVKLIDKSNDKSKKKYTKVRSQKDIVLKFLNNNERRVVQKLIEKNGSTLQSDINRMEGMTKLKTHRAVKDLKMKGIIKIENYGKTNRIILNKEFRNYLMN